MRFRHLALTTTTSLLLLTGCSGDDDSGSGTATATTGDEDANLAVCSAFLDAYEADPNALQAETLQQQAEQAEDPVVVSALTRAAEAVTAGRFDQDRDLTRAQVVCGNVLERSQEQ
jgi:hypothetical protein